jgi:hypothetical protein
MVQCVAIVQEGKRKGHRCEFNTDNDNGYCNKHQRNKIYDVGIAEGKRWCRFFFRGCDSVLSPNAKERSCISCRKKQIIRPTCKHPECTFQSNVSSLYCGKHARDVYRDEEKEKGIKYCDIDRGCFAICEKDKKSCNECLELQRQKDAAHLFNLSNMNAALQIQNSLRRVCHVCEKEYESYVLSNGTDATKCTTCMEKQSSIENKRVRNRIYQAEQYRNIDNFYKDWMRRAYKNGRTFELSSSQFQAIVLKPCHYCGFQKSEQCIGIDRSDNQKGYTTDNCVPCCKLCNRIKHAFDKEFFLEKATIISNAKPVQAFYDKWCKYYARVVKLNYDKYKKETIEKRKFVFNLTKEQWTTLLNSECYLCGYKSSIHTVGIDRVDNSKHEYTIDNCKPCCKSCNVMKHTMNYAEFVDHMHKIAIHQRS